jgi:hypothetical protein
VHSESTLQKDYLESIYNDKTAAIREQNGDACIWLSADVTTDALGRYNAHLIVGKLDPDKPSKPHLLCSKTLEKANSQSNAYFINKVLNILYPSEVDCTNMILLCTNAALFQT